MLRPLISLASPAGPRGRLSVMIFHRVLDAPDPLRPHEPDSASFECLLRWLRDWFEVVSLAQGVARLREGTLPSRALAITFDDGYEDNARCAAPMLRRFGMSATFFVSSGFLGGGCMWNDRIIEAVRAASGDTLKLGDLGLGELPMGDVEARRTAIGVILKAIKHLPQQQRDAATAAVVNACGSPSSPRLMMSPEQVRELRRLGMDVGGHTVTHPILARLPEAQARAEILDGKQRLEDILDESVRLFAYPNGVPEQDYSAVHVRLAAECGFDAAVSTAWGAASSSTDPFQVPRFTPWDRTRGRFGLRLLDNFRRREARVA